MQEPKQPLQSLVELASWLTDRLDICRPWEKRELMPSHQSQRRAHLESPHLSKQLQW